MSVRRAFGFAVLLSIGLAGCGGDEAPPPGAFAPLHYEFLNKLRLNVGTIDIQNAIQPLGPDDVSARSPFTPDQALLQIAHDRLFAAGLLGSATFTIDQASIVRGAEGGLYGQMAVHLEVLTAGGARAAYAEARVSQQHLPGSDDEDLPTTLYDMTRKMADSMNVELEYQMKRSMGDFLVPLGVTPPAVTAAPLNTGAPGLSPVSPPANPLPASPVQMVPAVPSPPAPNPDMPDATPPQMSPPPGYLQPPSASQ